MFIGRKRKNLIYLTERHLLFYQEDELLKEVSFPVEERTQEEFLKLFQEELGPSFLKKEVVIIVGGKLLFQKVFILSDGKIGEEDKEAFYKDLPIKEKDLARQEIITEQKLYLLGTNKVYYEPVFRLVKEVKAVLPLSLFSDDTLNDELSKEQLRTIYENVDLYEVGNFLKSNARTISSKADVSLKRDKFIPKEQIVVKESSFNFAGLIKLILLSFIFAIIFFLLFIFYDSYKHSSEEKSKVPTPTQIPSVTSEQPSKEKSALRIQIQNGTGTPGQAGMVEKLLIKSDFNSISIGNAEKQDHEAALFQVNKDVSEKVRVELKQLLESVFEKVDLIQNSGGNDYDVVIVTGTTKE